MSATENDIMWTPGWRLRELMLRRELSPVEVVGHFLERIERLDPTLNSFITVAPEDALRQARAAEATLSGGGAQPGPLFGLPISLKDNYWTKGLRTTAGSLVYKDHVPSEDSVCAERARAAGAIIVGKTNLPEFALFPRTVNRLTAECVNPWDTATSSGGSSGGAAASVAAGLTPLAIGTDGGGSIRIPAALCGVFGLNPSNGRVPRWGGFGGTLFFSGAGPITRDVRDGATLFQVLAGADARDPSCMKEPVPDYVRSLDEGVKGLKGLWVRSCGDIGPMDVEVIDAAARALRRLEDVGLGVEESASGFGAERWIEAFYVIMNADRYALFGQQLYEDPSVRGLLSEYGRDHFSRARTITAAEYVRSMQARIRLVAEWDRMFEGYDVVLSPTVGMTAPPISGPIVRQPLVAYTFLVNFAGYCAATVPCGFVGGLPIGLQIIARPNKEALVLRLAKALEVARPWASHRPPRLESPVTSGESDASRSRGS